MAFTVQDYTDLVRLLDERPEWRAELRRLLLTDDILALPQIVRDIVEIQKRTEVRVAELFEAQKRTEVRLEALVAAHEKSEQRLTRLEETVQRLIEAQQRTEQRLSELADQVSHLVTSHEHLEGTVGNMRGELLEMRHRDRAGAYFGPLLRRLKVVEPHTLEQELEASLSAEEFRDVLLLDQLVHGQPRYHPDLPEVWLAVEISAVVDEGDVERALRRAELLRRAGFRALPAVAGEKLTLAGEDIARKRRVLVFQDGRIDLWDEALEAWARV